MPPDPPSASRLWRSFSLCLMCVPRRKKHATPLDTFFIPIKGNELTIVNRNAYNYNFPRANILILNKKESKEIFLYLLLKTAGI